MARVDLVDVNKRYGATLAVADLNLRVNDGEFLTLLGGSGCGKTTTLNLIAGLETPSSGSILFDGDEVTALSPRGRNVAVVFQSYALYPHKTVAENLAFPLRMARVTMSEVSARVLGVARLLQIETLLDRKPRELSGGQQQRVALGRALIRRPQVFLLDEPLSNLDVQLRRAVRQDIKALHQAVQTTTIYVTHDQEEAMTLSDRIAVMHNGTVLQCAPPRDIYNAPEHLAVAQLVGTPPMNIIVVEQRERVLKVGNGIEVPIPGDKVALLVNLPRRFRVGIRPEHVRVTGETGGPRGTIVQVDHLGRETHVQIDCSEFTVTAVVDADYPCRVRDTVTWQWDWRHVVYFDPDTGKRI